MEENLSKELIEKLKNELLQKKVELEEQLTILSKEDSFSDPDRTVGNAEDGDEASEQLLHTENDLQEDSAELTLGLVEKALAKIEVGAYGICEIGNHPINPERLEAFPEAENCIEHAK